MATNGASGPGLPGSTSSQYGAQSFGSHTVQQADHNIGFLGNVKTAEWMLKIDDILSSTVSEYEDYAECFGWFAEQSRVTSGSTSNQLITSSTVQHSNVIVMIPTGIYDPVLEKNMNSGVNMQEMTIVRLAHVGEERKPLQTLKFTNVKMETKRQEHDFLILSFRIETRENTNFQYDQDGTPKGQSVTFFDYTKNSSDGGGGGDSDGGDGDEGGDDSGGGDEGGDGGSMVG